MTYVCCHSALQMLSLLSVHSLSCGNELFQVIQIGLFALEACGRFSIVFDGLLLKYCEEISDGHGHIAVDLPNLFQALYHFQNLLF